MTIHINGRRNVRPNADTERDRQNRRQVRLSPTLERTPPVDIGNGTLVFALPVVGHDRSIGIVGHFIPTSN